MGLLFFPCIDNKKTVISSNPYIFMHAVVIIAREKSTQGMAVHNNRRLLRKLC
jgi:hypothetical protein